jgi:hypothetical protein
LVENIISFKLKQMKALVKLPVFKIMVVSLLTILVISICFGACKKEAIKSAKKDIISFILKEQADTAKIDLTSKKITITVKYDAHLAKLCPAITISDKATISPASGDTVDFTQSPVKYIVTAEDKSTEEWLIYVDKLAAMEKKILSFTLAEQSSAAVIIDTAKTVTLTVKYNTNLAQLSPTITISEKTTIDPASGKTTDFTKSPVIYTITAEDKSKQEWMVYINKESEMEKKIVSFTIAEQQSAAVINETTKTISIEVKPEADLTKIKPEITVSNGSTLSPASGSEVDFSKGDVKFTISASDGSSSEWLVSVTRNPYTGKSLLGISIANQTDIVSDTVTKTFTITMPSGTNITSLSPVMTISPGAKASPASGAVVDFSTGSANFSVISEAGDTQVYVVKIVFPFIPATNANIQYTGRIDFTSPSKPRFSAPGVYIKAKFVGTFCDITIQDETAYNYIEVVIDNMEPVRLLMKVGKKVYRVASGLYEGEHTILICKDTEASIGSLYFYGLMCENLVVMPDKPSRKIECYGNSITCGAKMITGDLCTKTSGSNWNISNKAYMSYGAIVARDLNAQYHLTSVSGIGLVQSCCGMGYTMPDAYDRLFLSDAASPKWNFNLYIPDVVTICLGQNDGQIDSATFCSNYVKFIKTLRTHYSDAEIFCITSPMADNSLYAYQQKMLTAIVDQMNTIENDTKVHKVILSHGLNAGCQDHPSESQHILVAGELESAIKNVMGW